MSTNQSAGNRYEQHAVEFLQQQGLALLCKNHHCRFGEIDLIMKDGKTIVFVEVRYRKNPGFGGAAVSVTTQKQRKIALTALHYLQKVKKPDAICRFDVLAFNETDREWIQDAFQSPL